MPALIPDHEALTQLCRRHRIHRLSLFGSVAVGTARPADDVDLLVELEPEAAPSLLDMAAIKMELSALLQGRLSAFGLLEADCLAPTSVWPA